MKSRVQRGRRHLRDLLTECCAVHISRDGAISSYQRSDTSPDGAPCSCPGETGAT
jgi:hypothetical protein